MDKWEYMVLEQPAGVQGFTDRQSREEYSGGLHTVLNVLGSEGWQVMTYSVLPDGRAMIIVGRKTHG